MKRLILCAALISVAALADDDVIFRAMSDELSRARTLKLDHTAPPYFQSVWTHDDEGFGVGASFGALLRKGGGRQGSFGVNTRVGDPTLDNTNFRDLGDFGFFAFLTHARLGAPAEPDYDALRHGLWLAFDLDYKAAVEALAKKRAFLETKRIEKRPADFGKAPLVSKLFPEEKLDVSPDRWTKLVQRASAVFRSHSAAQTGEASYGTQRRRQYFLSTDGGKARFDELIAQLQISASGQAADGMEVQSRFDFTGRTDADLPSDEEVMKSAERVAARLDALVKAPALSEDYSGPVLFVGAAADAFFLHTLGDPLSHPRDDLGDQRQGRMIDRLGKHVAAKIVSVKDDPTQRTWHGQPLMGFFPVDDDGVVPQPISLVEEGVLKTYYMSRIPTLRVQQSNGHCRGNQGSVGNLFVETSQPESREALKKKLVELAKDEDLDYGLLVEEFEPATERTFFDSSQPQVTLPTPTLVYRVYADGREELVRGARFKPASYRVLKDIVGMGDQQTLLNTIQRGQHVSVVAPAVLVKTLDVQKPNEELDKPPFIPRPQIAKAH